MAGPRALLHGQPARLCPFLLASSVPPVVYLPLGSGRPASGQETAMATPRCNGLPRNNSVTPFSCERAPTCVAASCAGTRAQA